MLKFFGSFGKQIMKNIIQSVKGTREFYPKEMAIRNWLYSNLKKVSELYGYSEYDGPFLESIDLYGNQLTSLPKEIRNLKKLIRLY